MYSSIPATGYMFNNSTFGMKLDYEQIFLLLVKSVARWVCGVLDGPQMDGIPSLALDKVAGEMIHLCMKLETEENAMLVKGIAG